MKPKNHIVGKVRYLTYELHFPRDVDVWVQQLPFCQPLDNFIKNTKIYKVRPEVGRDLMQKGAASFIDNNLVTHVLKIEEDEKPTKWGRQKV